LELFEAYWVGRLVSPSRSPIARASNHGTRGLAPAPWERRQTKNGKLWTVHRLEGLTRMLIICPLLYVNKPVDLMLTLGF
jgi:hypothetical protein